MSSAQRGPVLAVEALAERRITVKRCAIFVGRTWSGARPSPVGRTARDRAHASIRSDR